MITEQLEQIRHLQERVEFNERIHCHYVAARLRREIDKIKKDSHDKTIPYHCGECSLIEGEDISGSGWCDFHQKSVMCDDVACDDGLMKGGENENT